MKRLSGVIAIILLSLLILSGCITTSRLAKYNRPSAPMMKHVYFEKCGKDGRKMICISNPNDLMDNQYRLEEYIADLSSAPCWK